MPQGCYTVIFSRDNCFATNKYTGSKIICQVFRKTFLDKSKRPRFHGRPKIYIRHRSGWETTTDAK
jgi:hypothetical protein